MRFRCCASKPPVPTDGIRFIDDTPKPAAAAPPPPPEKRRRGFPIGTLAFLGVVGMGLAVHHGHIRVDTAIRESDEVTREFEVDAAPKIEVQTFNGEINVDAAEDGRVSCTIHREASAADPESARAALTALVPQITQEGNVVRVKVERAEWWRNGWDGHATIHLRVPADSVLELGSSNANVRVSGVEGAIDATTNNASIEVHEGRGPIVLQSTNGPLFCEASDALLDLKTSNASIEFKGTVAAGVSKIKTSNGPIDLELGRDQAFRLEAKTSNAEIESDFPIKGESGRKRTRLIGSTGEETGAVLQVETSNGDIDIEEAD